MAILALIMVALGAAASLCVSSFSAENRPATPIAPTITPTKNNLTTISVLFIGADSLSAPQPRLESLTVLKYQVEVKRYFFIIMSPDTIAADGFPNTLQDYYGEDASHQRQSVLIQAALRRISSQLGGVYAEIDFDRHSMSETISQLSAFECMGQPQTGEQLLRQYDTLPAAASLDRLHFQGSLLECVFDAAQKQNWDLPTLMDKLGQRFYPSRDRAVIILEAAPALAQSEFTVIYTPLNPFTKATPQP